MDGHEWQVIIALAGTVQLLGGGIIKYLLNQLKEARDTLQKLNQANADLAKLVPGLLEEVQRLRKDRP